LTYTVSLGIGAFRGFRCPELRSWLSVSAREIPVLTGVNCTLMAWRSWPEPGRWPVRPSAFQAGHIPSCYGSCECYALSPVAAGCRWSLRLLSSLLSTQRKPSYSKLTRTLQGMARVRSGQAPAWPLASIAASSKPRCPGSRCTAPRKTCGSLLAALDVHPRVAMQILRHSKIAVTMEIYTEVPSAATRDALKKLGQWLGS
jgi:hypothetical protein